MFTLLMFLKVRLSYRPGMSIIMDNGGSHTSSTRRVHDCVLSVVETVNRRQYSKLLMYTAGD